MTEQEIRAKALEIAVAMGQNKIRSATDTAKVLAKWIETGELPEPEPGTFY